MVPVQQRFFSIHVRGLGRGITAGMLEQSFGEQGYVRSGVPRW